MRLHGLVAAIGVALAVIASEPLVLAAGRIEGRLIKPDGSPVAGVTVVVRETSATTISDATGHYAFDAIATGAYTLAFSLADNMLVKDGVRVGEGATERLDLTLDWALRYSDTITVYGASRHTERLVEAPASVSVIGGDAIAEESTQAQLPKLLASTPGVEMVQNGAYDFNINFRGFNGTVNRRILVLIDGRDPGGVLLGAQEWGAYGIQPDDLAKIEVIRGPGSALYGSNAFNGVVNFVSKEPRYARGGDFHLTFGERHTATVSGSEAGQLSPSTFYRLFGEAMRTDDFFQSRATAVEYPGLALEVIAPPIDNTSVTAGGARLDHYFGDARLLTVEGGDARIRGHIFVTPVGRTQDDAVWRPWARASYTGGAWNLSGFFDARNGGNYSLFSGMESYDQSIKLHAEALRRIDLPHGRGVAIAGGAISYARIDSLNPSGVETTFRGVEDGRWGGIFGQLGYKIGASLKAIVAMRVDASTLHATQYSPKAGLVYAIRPDQTVRASFGHAFQSASFVEFFTRFATAPPVDLSAVERLLGPVVGATPLHFANVPVLVVGNDQLKVETIDSFEGGYTGVLARQIVVSADYYRSRLQNFISSVLPQVGTSLGRINPAFGPYQPPSSLSVQQQAAVLGTLQTLLPPTLYPFMSNDLDGSPAFIVGSLTNYGQVNTQGLDLGVQYLPFNGLAANINYSWFDFTVNRDLPDAPLQANTSPHRVNGGVAYTRSGWTAGLEYRWSDRFKWAQGLLVGDVPPYHVVDVSAQRRLNRIASIRVDVSNALDNRHYEVFGGDLVGRRALADFICRW